jgi:hypothetical protein
MKKHSAPFLITGDKIKESMEENAISADQANRSQDVITSSGASKEADS